MLEDSNHKNELLEKYNISQYRGRFGISYSSKSSKGLSTILGKFGSKKNIAKFKLRKETTIKEFSEIKPFFLEERSVSNIKNNILNEVNEIEIERIYDKNNDEKEKEEILPIINFHKVSKCSVIKYGIKKSTEKIEYSYCKTCDHNLLRPICFHCINKCHKGHLINSIFNKGNIKCSCGEKNHIQINFYNNNINNGNIKCLCNEWNIISKLGFYYINKKNKPICILCHNYCQKNNKKDKIIKLEKDKTIPDCSCKNEEIHNSHRMICEKIINLISEYNEFHILLHPIQFINMLFKSNDNFKLIFEDFEIFMNIINKKEKLNNKEYFAKFHSIDITNTNIYKTLLIFEKMVEKKAKHCYIHYYNEKVVNYFSFEVVKNLYWALQHYSTEEKTFRILINKYIYLFYKFYINFKVQSLYKIKLYDLKNLSFIQRMIIFNQNKNIFKENEEIISFLLKVLNHIVFNGSSTIESIEGIKEIMAILRKLSCYNLINNEQMSNICLNILKSFDFIRIVRNSFIANNEIEIKNSSNYDLKTKKDLRYLNKILLKLYYIIMKMIMNFIYNYNDNTLSKNIYDKEKYPDIDSINHENVCFIYKRNELGRFIFEINISILSYLQKYFNNYESKKIILIQRIGMEIIQYALNKDDDYYLNILDSLNQIKNYYTNSLIINKNSQYYKELSRQCNLITNSFYQYFNFEITIEEMLQVINNSLNIVLGELSDKISSFYEIEIQNGFNYYQKTSILSTNYFSLISRVIGIIYHYQNRNNVFNDQKLSNNIKLNLFIQLLSSNIEDQIIKKILYFYFCFVFNSSYNSLLILSHSIFIEFTKLPIKYSQFSFKLFFICIKNILSLDIENNNIINFEQTHIIKRLYIFLEKLIEDKNIKQNNLLTCIYYFLQILEITIFNSYSSKFNTFIYKIQYILLSIDKKYNLINKFFDIKDNEMANQNRIIVHKSEKKVIEYKDINPNDQQTNIFIKNDSFKSNSLDFEFYIRNIIQKSFSIYIKLINDCFDFSIRSDKKKVEEIINIDRIIYALQNYKLNLDLRTEFLRFLRKILIDIKYSNEDNNLYTYIIINSKDNLKNLKNNPLINNMEYPTKLFSFLNDFYNITAKYDLTEKIKEKMTIKNYIQKDLKIDKSDNFDYIKNNKTNTINKRFSENFMKIKNINNKNFNLKYEDKNNNNTYNDENSKLPTKYKIEQGFKEYDEDLEKDKSNLESNISLNKSKVENNIMNDDIIIEENLSKIVENDSDFYKSKITTNNISNIIDEKDNNKINNKYKGKKSRSNLNLLKIENNINRKKLKRNKRGSCIIQNSLQQTFLFDSKKSLYNIKNAQNKSNIILNGESEDINSDDLQDLSDILIQNDNEKFYSKCKEMDILEDAFNEKFYLIINYELDNIKKNIENIKLNTPEKIEYVRNYIENGLLIPIIFYFKKIFTLIHFFTGNQMIKIFSLVEKSLKFKLFISQFNIDFWKNINNKNENLENDDNLFFEKNEKINPQNYYYTNYRNASIIEGAYFIDNKSIELTNEAINYINSFKMSMFDYTSLYQIIEKELFSLIKDRKILGILDNFKEKANKLLSKKIIKDDENLLMEKSKNYILDIQKRILKSLIIYKYSKLLCYNELNSSFFSILPEITVEYDSNFRNSLISLLIDYGKEISIKNEFAEDSYFILFKLLSFQKIEIQNDIINILEEDSENPGFLKDFNNILFYRIILLFIDYLNPPDKLIQSSYFVSCNIIYIFKLLCEDHNYFFQRHLVKSLYYSYSKDNPSFFKFVKSKENESSSSFSNEEEEKLDSTVINKNSKGNIEYSILFYDFFLYLLIKITLISNWENNLRKDHQYYSLFLYDLFLSILDLLTEIIQGSDYELLSTLSINFGEGVMGIIKDGGDIEKYKKIDSFEFFIKNIKNILFQEKFNLKFINEIRINIMYFITSILEEKNCNDLMKKYIKKYINIDNIYKIISIIMKSYYLDKEKPKNFEKIKKPLIGLMSSTKLIDLNSHKETLKRKNSNFTPLFRPRMNQINNINNKTQKNTLYTIEDNSSSNIKLMNNSTLIYKSLNKKLTLLNLNKNKEQDNLFKKILTNGETNNKNEEENLNRNKTDIENKEKSESLTLELKIANLIFGKKLYNYFKDQFYKDIDFTETLEFKLSNSFYRYIKILLIDKKKIKKKTNIEQIKKIIDIEGDIFLENLNDKDNNSFKKKPNIKENLIFERDLLEQYYIEKFFEDITNIVEIRTNEGFNKPIIYTKIPVMQFLSNETKIHFIKNVNRDNETTKKYDIIKYIDYFIKEIKYYKKYHNKWDFWFSKIDFKYMAVFSYLFALVYNLLLLFTLKGDIVITGFDKLKERHKNRNIIEKLINNSINEWNLIYNLFDYIYLLINLILIILWVLYKLPLYYKIDQIKYREIFKINKNKKLIFFDKFYILFKMGLMGRNYISMLIYEFIINIITITIKNSEIIFAFLLLPILFINKTLKNIMISIRLNYRPFFLTFCLAFIIMYIFSNIYFFFLNSDFYAELNYYNDNYCKTLIFSFLNALDNGLRARGGLGDSAIRISFLKNTNHYLIRLILDDIFFLLIVIIMIDMVFGIIVKSFDELRHRNQKYHTDKKNYCLICHSNRDSLEKIQLNFKEHVKFTHNLWNYVEYMISLKLKDIKELNNINKSIREKLDKKEITWLPTYKDILVKNENNNNNDLDENNLAVCIENFANYKIKSNNSSDSNYI